MPSHLHFRHTKFGSDKMAAKWLVNSWIYKPALCQIWFLSYRSIFTSHTSSRVSQFACTTTKWKFVLQLSNLFRTSSATFYTSPHLTSPHLTFLCHCFVNFCWFWRHNTYFHVFSMIDTLKNSSRQSILFSAQYFILFHETVQLWHLHCSKNDFALVWASMGV